MRVIQSESSSGSNTDAPQLDATTKLQAWKEVAGGKSRDRVYSTIDLVANYRQRVSSLTQSSFVVTATDYSTQMAREERFQNKLNESKEEKIARELQGLDEVYAVTACYHDGASTC